MQSYYHAPPPPEAAAAAYHSHPHAAHYAPYGPYGGWHPHGGMPDYTTAPQLPEPQQPPPQSATEQQQQQQQLLLSKERETSSLEEVAASFLLSLKHSRSVTPEPLWTTDDDENDNDQRRATVSSSESSLTQTPPLKKRSNKKKRAPTPNSPPPPLISLDEPLPPMSELVGDSPLVLIQDQDLVPDALFVAMAQMTPCRLTAADRVGCYKSRDIGFIGMCCKHCHGQPGFGRYYPNSVRSLAQTTTSQTILKHIGSKCRYCPLPIRQAVLQLQQVQQQQEAGQTAAASTPSAANGRPRYGSRKVFFQRVWARLHQTAETDVILEVPPPVDEAASSSSSLTDGDDLEEEDDMDDVASESATSKRSLGAEASDENDSNKRTKTE